MGIAADTDLEMHVYVRVPNYASKYIEMCYEVFPRAVNCSFSNAAVLHDHISSKICRISYALLAGKIIQ